MKILHYCPSEMGNRHYKKTEKELKRLMESFSGRYFVYRYAKPYKAMLEKRVEKNDILLITAHGAEAGILQSRPKLKREVEKKKYEYVISIDEANLFKNNITFSFACFTATEFGPTVIESGGQAYIGFKSEIGALTKVSKNSGHNKQVRNTYEYVSKIILTTTIAECVYKFIYDFQTAEICKQWFSLMLEKRLMDFFDMSAAQILKNYRYKIDEGTWAKHKGELQIYQLNILNNVQKEMVCLGDMNYISMLGFYLRESIPAEIVSRIKATEFQDAEYGRKFHKHLNSYLEI